MSAVAAFEAKHFADLIYERGLRAPDSTLAVLAFKEVLAARRSPVPADTPSEDGEYTTAGAIWALEATLREGKNPTRANYVWEYVLKPLVLASRPTPPEDVERVADLIRDGIRGERDDTSICVPVGDLKVLLAALAAVPADGETEWAESLVNDGTHEFTVSSDCDGSNEKRWMRIPRRVIKAGPWLPIPESEEQR